MAACMTVSRCDDDVVGTSVKRTDMLGKVTGAARYAGDLDAARHAARARSSAARSRTRSIRRIDTSKALALPGVKAVLTHENVPRVLHYGSPHPRSASVTRDQYILDNKVRYWGEGVAAVAAISEEIAEEALDLIEVEYEELPAVVHRRGGAGARCARDPRRRAGGNLVSPPAVVKRGDVERGFAEADLSSRALRDGPPDAGLHGAQRLRLPVGRQRQAHGLDLDADRLHGARHPRRGARRAAARRCACWSTTWAAASAPSRTCSRPSSCARCSRKADAPAGAHGVHAQGDLPRRPLAPSRHGVAQAGLQEGRHHHRAPGARHASTPAPTARTARA